MSIGLLLGSYVMKKHIESAYYVVEETNDLMTLPLIELKVSEKKKEILITIYEGKNSIKELENSLNLKASTLYVHLKSLRDDGFINKDNKITDMGKIALLHSNN